MMTQVLPRIFLGLWMLWPLLSEAHAELSVERLKQLQTETRQVARQCLPATVAILSGPGSGSGVVVNESGLVLTAAHVIQGSQKVQLVFPDGREAWGRVLGAYFTRDIAMVQLEGQGPWPHVNLGSSADLELGEWVVALGHAKGFDPNRTPPLRFARVMQNSKRGFILTDCTLIGGDSGGPLFNLKGELVGIHSSIGNNLSINNHAPIDAFKEEWDQLLAGKSWGQLGRHPLTDPDSPVLGIGMERRRHGIGVGEVFENSPAARAGLRAGDILRAINGHEVRDAGDLLRELSKYEAGEVIEVKLRRDRKKLKLPLTLQKRSEVLPRP